MKKYRHSTDNVPVTQPVSARSKFHKAAPSKAKRPRAKVATKPMCNRKFKSLGLLCTRFIMMHKNAVSGKTEIHLDRVATKLGVERRRIYDCVNIMESVLIVRRHKKNVYVWDGFEKLGATLLEMQRRVKLDGIFATHEGFVAPRRAKSSGQAKSLATLSQNFISLYLSDTVPGNTLTLDEAAGRLMQADESQAQLKTKARRPYGIANVCCSLELLEKITKPKPRKPSFRWMGLKTYPHPRPAGVPAHIPCPQHLSMHLSPSGRIKRPRKKTQKSAGKKKSAKKQRTG